MRIIGLTGGIASGKSTVSQELKNLGAVILDADKIAWNLAEPDKAIWQAYFDRYGEAVINVDRTLNRQAVADRVFSDENELKWMNEMAHPLIKEAIKKQIKIHLEKDKKRNKETDSELVLVLDVPLLFESKWDVLAEETWLVYTDHEHQVARLKSRNNIDVEEAERRIASQMSMKDKLKLADVIIPNMGTYEELIANVHQIWQKRVKTI